MDIAHSLLNKSVRMVFLVVVLLIIVLIAVVTISKKMALFVPGIGANSCTLEAKLCPNGTTVGRKGPNCEFDVCPSFAPQPTTKPVKNKEGCTMDAKLCPNGTAVGRKGPNCEFEVCPSTLNQQPK
ncbi:MAG: hypothetical protein WCO78_04525 [Candidatus Roizmanbacteria bacterium]